jgi:hypothetical protein
MWSSTHLLKAEISSQTGEPSLQRAEDVPQSLAFP